MEAISEHIGAKLSAKLHMRDEETKAYLVQSASSMSRPRAEPPGPAHHWGLGWGARVSSPRPWCLGAAQSTSSVCQKILAQRAEVIFPR